MTVTIFTTSPSFGRLDPLKSVIADAGWRLVRCDDAGKTAMIAAELPRADFLVAGLVPVDAATLDAAPRLKGVLKHGVGTDAIDIAAATERGVPVTNTPGANANAVAELAIGAIFCLSRGIVDGHRRVTAGHWTRHVGREVAGAVLGVVGLGNIGRCLAVKARALGMTVVASDLCPDMAFARTHGITILPLAELLAQADHVSLHVFGDDRLIGATELSLMKPAATLLNMARGNIVDLDALSAAIGDGRLGGAAIDAFPTEPPDTRHPIFAQKNVVFTPHSGADTAESVRRMGEMVVADIRSLIAGERPERCLNPQIWA